MVLNWYHFVAIAILHQPRPTDSADINTRLQLSGFLLTSYGCMRVHLLIHALTKTDAR